jgi:malate dehydrogenase (oxaloacetate-decarboxylating)(NADP+)
MGDSNKLVMSIRNKARQNPKRVVFAEGNDFKVLKAVQFVVREKIAHPILLGNEEKIKSLIKENQLELDHIPIIDTYNSISDDKRHKLAKILYEKRKRKGMTYDEAVEKTLQPRLFWSVDGGNRRGRCLYFRFLQKICRYHSSYIAGNWCKRRIQPHCRNVYHDYQARTHFFADATVNMNPSPQTLVDTTILTANEVKRFNIEPRIALLSYSNFGAFKGLGSPVRVKEAVKILHQKYPDLWLTAKCRPIMP